jgi:hypothetical protein
MGSYIVEETSSGLKTLIYKNSKDIRLHSAYDPLKEAERSVDSFKKGRSSIILVSGLALGYHVCLLKKKYPDVLLIVLEYSIEVVKLSKKHYPGNIKNALIITSITELSGVFETIDMSGFRGISHYIHRASYQLNQAFYDNLASDIKQYITSKTSDLLTRFEFERRWIENIFLNLPYLFTSYPVSNLFGRFKGYPGIIVSAGPSLRKNVSMLDKIKDKALIVSVDTAYGVLLKNKISPHIVMTLDAQKYSIKHFLGQKSKEPLLLADIVSYGKISRDFPGEKAFSTTSKFYQDIDGNTKRETTPAVDWLEKVIGNIGDIQSGGSVATSVFDLLLNLGCDPIILVGQDLAYTGREIHVSGTYHNDDWLPQTNRILNLDTINQRVIRKRKIKFVESFGGAEPVISDFVFDLYKGWFEDSAAKVPVKVINATEGGARLKNTSENSLEILTLSLKKNINPPSEVLKKALSGKKFSGKEKLISGLKKSLKDLNEISRLSDLDGDMISISSEILSIINKNGMETIFTPFLRKINIYLSRNDIDEIKSSELIIRDVKNAVENLKVLMSNALAALGNL